MRVVRDGTLYQLAFLPRFLPINCYLVEEDRDLTLVDAALPYSAQGILRVAEGIGKPIARIVLTHAHNDHLGALKTLKKALPNAPVYISAREARLLAADRSLDPEEPQTPIRGGVPKRALPAPDVTLADGDRIGSLLAMSTPGHTPGSMSFFDVRTRALVAGDAFQECGGLAVSGQIRPRFPFPAWATWNKAVALESAHRLVRQRPALLATGHGKLLKDPVAMMNRAIAQEDPNRQRSSDERNG